MDTEARESITRARATAPAPAPGPAWSCPRHHPRATRDATAEVALEATMDKVPSPKVTNTHSIMGAMSIMWTMTHVHPSMGGSLIALGDCALHTSFQTNNSVTPHDCLFVTCLFIRHSAFLLQRSVFPHHLANNCSNDPKKQIRRNQCGALIGEHGGYNDGK